MRKREGEGKEGGEIDSKRGGQIGKKKRSEKERGRERETQRERGEREQSPGREQLWRKCLALWRESFQGRRER